MVIVALVVLTIGAPVDARLEFEKGSRLFKAEEYSLALGHFQKAYEASGRRPSATLALAQCERMLGLYDEALAHFFEYLASEPPKTEADRIRETMEVVRRLKKKREAETTAPEPDLKVPEPEPPPPPAGPQSATLTPEVSAQPESERSFWSHPAVWIVAGVTVVASAIAIGVVASRGPKDPFSPTGVVLRPEAP